MTKTHLICRTRLLNQLQRLLPLLIRLNTRRQNRQHRLPQRHDRRRLVHLRKLLEVTLRCSAQWRGTEEVGGGNADVAGFASVKDDAEEGGGDVGSDDLAAFTRFENRVELFQRRSLRLETATGKGSKEEVPPLLRRRCASDVDDLPAYAKEIVGGGKVESGRFPSRAGGEVSRSEGRGRALGEREGRGEAERDGKVGGDNGEGVLRTRRGF